MKVLVAPWGAPEGWKDAVYKYGEEQVCSKSSLTILKKVLEPRRTVIIVLDTLCDNKSYERYDELCENVKSQIVRFLESKLKINPTSIEILVAPGVGEFKNCVFKGSMRDYYSFVLYELSKILIPEGGELSIHLDLTHGINFMPVLTYMAVNEILGILAMNKRVELAVYNSEPYSHSGRDELNVHEVEKRSIEYRFPNEKLNLSNSNLRLLNLKEIPEKERRQFNEKNRMNRIMEGDFVNEINAFLGSIKNGLPLGILRFFPDINKIEGILEDIVKDYRTCYIDIKWSNEGNKVSVHRQAEFNPNFDVLTKVWLNAKMLGYKRKTEVSLNELKNIARTLFEEKDNVRFWIIGQELWNIEKKRNKFTNEWVLYEKFFDSEEGVPSSWRGDKRRKIYFLYEKFFDSEEGVPGMKNKRNKKGGLNERHFFAHAGLERNCVEIRKKRKEILLRYKEGFDGNIMEFAQEGLK